MTRTVLRSLCMLLLSSPLGSALAQSFNVDLGAQFAAPSSAFGAAASQPGTWNTPPIGTTALVSLAGAPTSVSATVTAFVDVGFFGSGGTDSALLLDDYIFTCAAPQTWSVNFSGLQNGLYSVYLYAPASPAVVTGGMEVNGVGAPRLPGSSETLTQGQTWVVVPAVVTSGTLAISGDNSIFNDKCAGLAGIQLVFQGSAPAPTASVYVDLGPAFGAPEATYAAAAPSPGAWTTAGLGTKALVGLNGAPNGASINVTAGTDVGSLSPPATNDGFLLGDNLFTCAPPKVWSVAFSGLNDGTYTVYLYAPENPSVSTGAMLVGATPIASLPGGIATLVQGTSWVSTPTTVANGTLSISGDASALSACAGIAGIQLVAQAPATPTIGSIAPNTGSVTGGQTVTVSGTSFLGATGVTVGGVAASFTVNGATSITLVAPAHAAGAVDVVVATPGGIATSSGGYTYRSVAVATPPTAVPTLSEWTLMLLAVALATLAARRLRS